LLYFSSAALAALYGSGAPRLSSPAMELMKRMAPLSGLHHGRKKYFDETDGGPKIHFEN
jgi:hypothetical protein